MIYLWVRSIPFLHHFCIIYLKVKSCVNLVSRNLGWSFDERTAISNDKYQYLRSISKVLALLWNRSVNNNTVGVCIKFGFQNLCWSFDDQKAICRSQKPGFQSILTKDWKRSGAARTRVGRLMKNGLIGNFKNLFAITCNRWWQELDIRLEFYQIKFWDR